MRFVALHVPLILGVKVLRKALNILNFFSNMSRFILSMSGHKIVMNLWQMVSENKVWCENGL